MIRFISIFITLVLVSCSGMQTSTHTKRNAELVVTYNGEVVHTAGSKYKTVDEFREIIQRKGPKYIVFGAKWCKSCGFLERALKQSNHFDKITFINVEEEWVAFLMSEIGIRSIPTMVIIGEDDKLSGTFVGPSKIIMHLLINVKTSP